MSIFSLSLMSWLHVCVGIYLDSINHVSISLFSMLSHRAIEIQVLCCVLISCSLFLSCCIGPDKGEANTVNSAKEYFFFVIYLI